MVGTELRKQRIRTAGPSAKVHVNRISFNVSLYRTANLETNEYVRIRIDNVNRKIGFKFEDEPDDYNYKLVVSRGGKATTCSCAQLQSLPWVKAVAHLTIKPAFPLKREGSFWVITLCPAFELSCKRTDAAKIPSDARGIYRYMLGGKIVYIGKGFIKNRLNEEQRKGWQFDTIEYSNIENEQDALFWENYWINRFKDENNSEFPPYNTISGHGAIAYKNSKAEE